MSCTGSTRRRWPSRSSRRPTARWATWGRRSPSSWRGRCARRRASSRRKSPARFGAVPTASPASKPHRTAISTSFSIGRHSCWQRLGVHRAARDASAAAAARRSSSIPPSTRTRRRTSATSATPRSATRWSACSASAARRSRCRTTSTTPACRSPTWSSASASSRALDLAGVQRIADSTRFDYYCWDLYAQVTEWYGQDKERLTRARRHAARHRARRQSRRGHCAISSPTASCAATCGRWRASTSTTTC